MHNFQSQIDIPLANDNHERLRCGTLVYTKMGLFALFAWLLWGDFCFSLMETIWPNILPLVLKAEGAPNTLLALAITTIPSAMNFVLNPIISSASDRYRGRRGRRIPFLLVATPFVTFFLILLGFSHPLGELLHHALSGVFPQLSRATITIGLICGLVACFRFFELFVNTVFWYLFNDVVPSAFIGRFLGCFRVVGSLAGVVFNFFIFRYAESHASTIFFCVALLYGTVFFLMCLNVREGQYPPPTPMPSGKILPWAYFKTFFKECFTHRIFRLVFASNMFVGVSNAINVFAIFMAFSIGLDLGDVGKVAGMVALGGMVMMYPVGVLIDRFHPIRVMMVVRITLCLAISVEFVFLFHDFQASMVFWIYVFTAGIALSLSAVNTAVTLPMLMRIFPHDRFGQFCAANAICNAMGMALGGILAGLFLDWMKVFFGAKDYYYRFVPVWGFFFSLFSLLMLILVFREWKELGGAKDYHPPFP